MELEVETFINETDNEFGVKCFLTQSLWRGMNSSKSTRNMMTDLMASAFTFPNFGLR